MIKAQGSRFLVDCRLGPSRRRILCESRQEAETLEQQLLSEAQTALSSAQGWTLGEAFERVTTTVWNGTSGGKDATFNAAQAVAFFGPSTLLSEIGTDWIDLFVASLKRKHNANGTINRKLAALSKLFSYAIQRGKVASKPHFPRLKEAEGRIRFLTEAEEHAMYPVLIQWGKQDHVDAIQVLIDTGMRPSELWRLEGRDCNFQNRVLTLWITKNGKARSVPMTARVYGILHTRSSRLVRGPLFPFDNNWLSHTWDRMKQHLGLQDDTQFIPYVLRHTCASRLVQRGVSFRVVQEWMGHKTPTVTMRYSHLSPANLTEAVNMLEQKGA